MKRNIFLEWIGYEYILNTRSMEIHRIKYVKPQCGVSLITKGKYISEKRAIEMFLLGEANGCKHCFKQLDTD